MDRIEIGVEINKDKLAKSPLREKPLRYPGQSLDEEINRIYDEKISADAYYLAVFLGLIAYSWILYFFPQKSSPVLITILSVFVIVFSLLRIQRSKKQIRQLKLGRDGEKAVAEILDDLRSRGYGVLHDVPGHKSNFDHVVFAPSGIYVIETKTASKKSPNDHVTFDGETIRVAGYEPSRNPIVQVKAASHELKELLKRSSGKSFPVKGVVVFPEWFVEPPPKSKKAEVWVLNPKALPTFISNEPSILKEDEVRLAVFHVSRIVRASD